MNLVLPGILDERVSEDRSQWFTPASIASCMACWQDPPTNEWSVLEPSAGSGNLVRAALDQFRGCTVEAVESDPYYSGTLRALFNGRDVEIDEANYLDRAAPVVPYDLALMNPPFEDGLDGEFLAKAMRESLRVTALVRLVSLAGSKRHEHVWSQVGECKPWQLLGLAVFSARPRFIAGRAVGDREDAGSAKADFCVVKLSRVASEFRGTEVTWV